MEKSILSFRTSALCVNFLVCLFLGSCSFISPAHYIIEGEIKNNEIAEVAVLNLERLIKVPVNEGSFRYKIPAKNGSNYFQLKIGDEEIPLFVLPNTPVYVVYDPENMDTSIKISGATAKECDYLLKQSQEGHSNAYKRSLLNVSDFQESLRKYITKKNQTLDSLHSTEPSFNKEFYNEMKLSLQFSAAEEKIIFPINKWYEDHRPINLEDEYFSFLKNIDLNHPEYLEIPNFKSLVNAYVMLKSPNLWDSSIDEVFRTIDENLSHKTLKEYAYFQELEMAITYKGVDGVADKIEFFNAYTSNPYYTEFVQKGFQKWEHLNRGNKAPEIRGQDINGQQISSANFKGKLIYVDVWATWCNPCIAELPYLQELKEAYQNTPELEIIGVSMDTNGDHWKSFLKKKKLKGIQLWNSMAFESQMSKDYLIEGLPRYILIDKDDRIVSSTAPRPSQQDKLRRLIDTQLTQMNAP